MANLGAIVYSPVIWTAGDIITEAKLDNMVANDQAYDSHKDQGLLLSNLKALAGKVTGGTDYNLIMINGSNILEIGDAGLDGLTFMKPITKPTLNGSVQNFVESSGGATEDFDCSTCSNFAFTTDQDVTFSLSNVTKGQWIGIDVIFGGVHGITWWSGIKWSDGVEPPPTSVLNTRDSFIFHCVGAGQYVGYVANQNVPTV